MNVCKQTQSLATGRIVHGAADDCARQARMVTLLNIQYHQFIQATLLRREILRCRPQQRAKAVVSIRVGNRHGASTKPREVVTGVICRPARVLSPGNSQTAHGDGLRGLANQTDRVAPGGCGWRRTHPPPWLFQYAGQLQMSASLAL
jgi:hypothetical protein